MSYCLCSAGAPSPSWRTSSSPENSPSPISRTRKRRFTTSRNGKDHSDRGSMIAIADHLWQSTLFAIAAALLTLVLRQNRAAIRFRLWLAASLKFLLPFTLLSALGRRLAWVAPPAAFENGLRGALAGFGHPFARTFAVRDAGDPIPMLLAGIWLCGMAMVLSAWYLRWRTLAAAIREAVPLHEGREAEALRRMQRIAGIRRPIAILLTPASWEPGIFGIVSPVLLWPQGISSHFDDANLEAV